MDRETTDEMIEQAIETLVESEDDIKDAQREREEFLSSTVRPTHPREFDNLQAFLDFYWQVQDYNDALAEQEDALARAIEAHERVTQQLQDLFPLEVPLRYTYRGERDRLQNQRYLIVKTQRGFQVQRQIPIEGG